MKIAYVLNENQKHSKSIKTIFTIFFEIIFKGNKNEFNIVRTNTPFFKEIPVKYCKKIISHEKYNVSVKYSGIITRI